MLPTGPQHSDRLIKRSSAKSWTRSWLYQSQDSANLRNLGQRGKRRQKSRKIDKTKFETDAKKLKYSFHVSCLIWKNNLKSQQFAQHPQAD